MCVSGFGNDTHVSIRLSMPTEHYFAACFRRVHARVDEHCRLFLRQITTSQRESRVIPLAIIAADWPRIKPAKSSSDKYSV